MEIETEIETNVELGGNDESAAKTATVKSKPAAKKPQKRSLYERAKDKARQYKAAAGKYIDDKVRVALDNVDVVKKWYDDISLKKMETVNPLFAQILPRAKELFLADVKDADVQIRHGQRTAEEQRKLYNQNTAKKWVTDKDGYKSKSNHQSPAAGLPGQAVDFQVSVNGKYLEDGAHPYYRKFYECVKQAADEKGITDLDWGGLWKKVDAGHLEYKGPMTAGPPSTLTNKKASPAFKKACIPCKQPKESPGTRFMQRVIPEGSVLDTYFKANPLPTQNLFKM